MFNGLLVIAALCCLTVGSAAWTIPRSSIWEPSGSGTLKEVRANKFVLESEKGAKMAVLGSDPNGWPELVFVDPQETPRLSLDLSSGIPSLSLHDKEGLSRTLLMVTPEGTPVLVMMDSKGVFRNKLALDKNGSPSLLMADEKDNPRLVLGANTNTLPTGKVIHYPEGSVVSYSPDGKIRWRTP